MIEINVNDHLAVVTIRGSGGLADLQMETEHLLNHPEHTPGMDEIWDLRDGMLVGGSPSEMLQHVDFIQQRRSRLADRVAFVIGSKLQYGLIRMWESYSETETHQENRIFDYVVSAREWLLESRSANEKSGNEGSNE